MEIGGDERCGKCGKSEAFFAELFPSTWWESSRGNRPKAHLSRFPQVRHFPQRGARGDCSMICGKEIEDTPSPLRINFSNR